MSKREPNVLIAGVAGFNRGDDAIACALVNQLRSDFRLGRIYVTVLRPGIFQEGGVQEVVVNRRDPRSHLQLCRAVADCQLVMIGGGSIIQDEYGATWLRGIMALYVEVVLLARLLARPIVSAPIGVDPLRSLAGKRMARFILGNCRSLTVRDAVSQRNAHTLLGADASVTLGVDPALWFPGKASSSAQAPYLVLAPAFESDTSDELAGSFARVIEAFVARRPGARCLIVAMDERVEQDGGRIKSILEQVAPAIREFVALSVPATVAETVGILRGAHAVVAMRLHAVILAAGVTPTFCISRGAKTDAIAADLEVPVISLGSGRTSWRAVESKAIAFLEEMQSASAREQHLRACVSAVARHEARRHTARNALRDTLLSLGDGGFQPVRFDA